MSKTKFCSEDLVISSVPIWMICLNYGSSILCKSLKCDCGNDTVKDILIFLLCLMVAWFVYYCSEIRS